MAYKIVISKKGKKAGEAQIETLDATSCSTIHEIAQVHNVSVTSKSHDDDNPVHDSINITE